MTDTDSARDIGGDNGAASRQAPPTEPGSEAKASPRFSSGGITCAWPAAARALRATGLMFDDASVIGWCEAHSVLQKDGVYALTGFELEALRLYLLAAHPPPASPPIKPPGSGEIVGKCTLCGSEHVELPYLNPGVYDGSARVCAPCGEPPPIRAKAKEPVSAAASTSRELLSLSAAGWTLRVVRGSSSGVTIDVKRSTSPQ